jgi:hypothetical protein
MSINISAFAGAGAQFFDANGVPLTGGLIYTYLAGTTTPAVTYTSKLGTSNNTNPIVLDAAGRTPAEIWMTGGVLYKFVLKSSTFVQIGSYDDIPVINDVTSVNTLITVSGTNALTGLATPTLIGYVAGAQYTFSAQNNNTGPVTIDIDTLGAKSITKAGSIALVANDLVAGALYQIVYDGARFQLLTRTSSSQLVVGTTAQRPSSPTAGMVRMNTTTLNPEWYDTTISSWSNFSQPAGYSVSYLVVAGGGGGAGSASSNYGGGGGAGGLLTGTATLSSGTSYIITVGSGGAGGTNTPTSGSNGTNSNISVLSLTAFGGGGGGPLSGGAAGSGGSGGGTGAPSGAGAGTTGQGFAGGTSGGQTNSTGGGGGASAVGVTPGVANTGGAGGAGASNLISGSAVNYAGGGGGAGFSTIGAGGVGGGGSGGSSSPSVASTAGTANTGGGGGGSGNATSGASGGSGIIIISYAGAQRGTGGTVTTSGGYTIHTFTASGTYDA